MAKRAKKARTIRLPKVSAECDRQVQYGFNAALRGLNGAQTSLRARLENGDAKRRVHVRLKIAAVDVLIKHTELVGVFTYKN